MNGLYLYIIAIVAALLPVALLFFYVHWQDKEQHEPAQWLWAGMIVGILSAALTTFIMKYVPFVTEVFPSLSASNAGVILNAFVCASIPEELIKFFMLWFLLRKNPYFDEYLDGIVYATCIGLGFASLENLLCLFKHLDDLSYVASMRALFAVPGHFFYAIVMGYYYSKGNFGITESSHSRRKYITLALAVPILMHGIYDSIIMSIPFHDDIWYTGCIILLLILCHLMLRKTQRHINDLKLLDINKFKRES